MLQPRLHPLNFPRLSTASRDDLRKTLCNKKPTKDPHMQQPSPRNKCELSYRYTSSTLTSI
eukprot:3967900-Amphidinium_carterae.2